MHNQIWSWVLTIVGISGFILAGRKVWWCWYINIFCQALWFIYAIVTEQYGFIIASLMYTVVFSKNAYAWTKEHREKLENRYCGHIGPKGLMCTRAEDHILGKDLLHEAFDKERDVILDVWPIKREETHA